MDEQAVWTRIPSADVSGERVLHARSCGPHPTTLDRVPSREG